MASVVLRLVNLLALMVSVAWLTRAPSWEPLLATITCFAVLIGQEIAAIRRPHVNPDVALFKDFLKDLPSEGSISFIKDYDFHGPFRLANLDRLYDFRYQWDRPEREFRDRSLDKKRKGLLQAVEAFTRLIGQHTSPQTEHLNSLSPTIQRDDPEEFARIGNEINSAADVVFKRHGDLVRAGRRQLHV
jgi:hypothetical protein